MLQVGAYRRQNLRWKPGPSLERDTTFTGGKGHVGVNRAKVKAYLGPGWVHQPVPNAR